MERDVERDVRGFQPFFSHFQIIELDHFRPKCRVQHPLLDSKQQQPAPLTDPSSFTDPSSRTSVLYKSTRKGRRKGGKGKGVFFIFFKKKKKSQRGGTGEMGMRMGRVSNTFSDQFNFQSPTSNPSITIISFSLSHTKRK